MVADDTTPAHLWMDQTGGRVVIIYIPFLVCIIGALVYALATNGKVGELGRIAYGCGLLIFLAELAGHVVSLLR